MPQPDFLLGLPKAQKKHFLGVPTILLLGSHVPEESAVFTHRHEWVWGYIPLNKEEFAVYSFKTRMLK